MKPIQKLNLMHNFVALRGLELVFVVAGVERHQEMALQMLFHKTAAVQFVVFTLQTLGFSQDRINFKVDHVGDLCLNGGDGDQLENPLTLGVSVVHLHSILSHLLSLS